MAVVEKKNWWVWAVGLGACDLGDCTRSRDRAKKGVGLGGQVVDRLDFLRET